MSQDSRRPHLLYIAFCYPPSRSSGVYRAVATVNAFARAGWDVTVLTVDEITWRRATGTDDPLGDTVDPAVRVVRTPDLGFHDYLDGDLRRWPLLRVVAPYVWRERARRASRQTFPEDWIGPWLAPASELAARVHAEHPVDLAIATASPQVSCAVAASLPGVPYVLDYRDAWALHTITGEQVVADGSEADVIERRLLAGASEVWFVNEPILRWHLERHPSLAGRAHVVPNGFDPQPGRRPPQPSPRPAGAPVDLGYLGTLNPTTVPLGPLVEGWVGAHAADPALRGHLRGHITQGGVVGQEVRQLLADAEAADLRVEGPISKTQVWDFYGRMDALLLTLASGRYVTGGKTAEYLSTGLPIVSVHDEHNAATDLLREYPLWFPATELTPDAVRRAVLAAADAVRTPDPGRWAAAWEYGSTFERSLLLEPRIAALHQEVTR